MAVGRVICAFEGRLGSVGSLNSHRGKLLTCFMCAACALCSSLFCRAVFLGSPANEAFMSDLFVFFQSFFRSFIDGLTSKRGVGPASIVANFCACCVCATLECVLSRWLLRFERVCLFCAVALMVIVMSCLCCFSVSITPFPCRRT